MAFDKSIRQYYSRTVNIDHIRTYIWDRDLEDFVAVAAEENYLFTFYYDSNQITEERLHYHLDDLCEFLEELSVA